MMGEPPIVLKLVLYGSVIPSKKNSKQIAFNSKTNRPFIISSSEYADWQKVQVIHAIAWKQEMKVKYGIKFPITKASCSIRFYWSNKRNLDNTNKAESIHDLLVDAGIISDDRWQVLNPTSQESSLATTTPRCEIYLSNFI